MADSQDADRLADLDRRLKALEEGDGGSSGGGSEEQEAAPSAEQAALVQAFLQGALIGNAGAQASGGGEDGTAPAFLSIFGCRPGGGGWSPTRYDSIFWCRSRFMCNPQSLSCLC